MGEKVSIPIKVVYPEDEPVSEIHFGRNLPALITNFPLQNDTFLSEKPASLSIFSQENRTRSEEAHIADLELQLLEQEGISSPSCTITPVVDTGWIEPPLAPPLPPTSSKNEPIRRLSVEQALNEPTVAILGVVGAIAFINFVIKRRA